MENSHTLIHSYNDSLNGKSHEVVNAFARSYLRKIIAEDYHIHI